MPLRGCRNLALTDILSLLVSVPFTASLYPLQRWIFGEFLCKFGNYIQQVSMQVTSVTLLAMNMDRWYMATFPLETLHQRSTCVAGVIVCSIWLGSFLISTPVLVYTHLQQGYWDGPQQFCTHTFPTKYHEQVFILYNFFMVYLLPMTSNLLCYTTILFQIGRAREDPNDSVEVQQLKERLDALRLKLTRMVSLLVLLYTICWGPTHFLSLLQGFSPHVQFSYCLYRLKIWARCMSYISFSVNPILYAFLGKNFQKSFKKELPFLFKKRPAIRARNSVHMEMQVVQ
ncbi:kiSS-1 receptor [Varanus komodoensis]|uniref:kiSS-1 receptor n=1 Tax=Varanus komodoensis TaxID=61221 RepID=UPI001CF7CB69|nr:kiSS-1 receptor [Varanus komodoensis]